MKLIDILVSELPNLGGWPDGVIKMSQDYDGEVWCWRGHGYGNVNSFARISEIADNHRKQSQDEELSCFVTREQYEAALAASKPEWDGERLPPVDTEVEVSVDGGRTWCTYKAISEHNGMRLVEIGNFTEEFQSNNWMFRPIRSEADKKKEDAVFAIAELCRQSASNGHSAELIYDAIKSGKIVID